MTKLDIVHPQSSVAFLDRLKMIIFSHNHGKSDYEYIFRSPLSWSVVRDPCSKYSVRAQKTFFKIPEFAFLFCLFAKSNKADVKSEQDQPDRVLEEIAKLAILAREKLTKARTHPLREAFIAYLNKK